MRKSIMAMVFAAVLLLMALPAGNAAAAQNQWSYSNGHWYYYNASGSLQKGWLHKGNKWYYFNTTGVMQTGLQSIQGKTYYFNTSGLMQTGWVKISNKWYYFSSSGAMKTGWMKSGKSWYFLSTKGMATGWAYIQNKWYYFNSSGVMQTGWVKSGGKWYFLNDYGAMQTGWAQSGSKWYYLNNSGVWENQPADARWKNKWTRTELHYEGLLTISNVRNSKFDMDIQVANGANVGEMEGTAYVSGNKAVFVNQEYDTVCRLDFTLNKNSITVIQTDGCNRVGGEGTFFNGEYKDPATVAQTPSPTLSSQGIIDAAHDAKIQKLLIPEDYDLLVESMQQYSNGTDLDGLGATVVKGGVRGLYTIMEGAIMYDPKGYYYVALISEDQHVKFYTNNPNYKNKLPKTIDNWRERFSDDPVEYYFKTI